MIDIRNIDLTKCYYYWDKFHKSVAGGKIERVYYEDWGIEIELDESPFRHNLEDLYSSSVECLAEKQKPDYKVGDRVYLIDRLEESLDSFIIITKIDSSYISVSQGIFDYETRAYNKTWFTDHNKFKKAVLNILENKNNGK